MSLYVDIRINTDTVGRIMITCLGDDTNTDPDAVHTYRWRRARNDEPATVGTVEHRHGDSAEWLAMLVLRDIANTDQVNASKPCHLVTQSATRSSGAAL